MGDQVNFFNIYDHVHIQYTMFVTIFTIPVIVKIYNIRPRARALHIDGGPGGGGLVCLLSLLVVFVVYLLLSVVLIFLFGIGEQVSGVYLFMCHCFCQLCLFACYCCQ